MDFGKFTERVRSFIQLAHSLAMKNNHQQVTPWHLIKVFLEDSEGLVASLVVDVGGDSTKILDECDRTLGKLPKVTGEGAKKLFFSSELEEILSESISLVNCSKLVSCVGDGCNLTTSFSSSLETTLQILSMSER